LCLRFKAELDRNGEDDKVENRGADGLGHEDLHEWAWITRAEAPTSNVLKGEIPVSINRVTRNPT
jgi:hypothetical protein